MKLNARRLISKGGLALIMIGTLPMLASAQPQLTIQSEEAAHPRLVAAIQHLKDALHDLENAPEDFGGHKGQAMSDIKVAIHSVRKALYFRLHMDDAAIDRVQ